MTEIPINPATGVLWKSGDLVYVPHHEWCRIAEIWNAGGHVFLTVAEDGGTIYSIEYVLQHQPESPLISLDTATGKITTVQPQLRPEAKIRQRLKEIEKEWSKTSTPPFRLDDLEIMIDLLKWVLMED